jgi:hypothetical protein
MLLVLTEKNKKLTDQISMYVYAASTNRKNKKLTDQIVCVCACMLLVVTERKRS